MERALQEIPIVSAPDLDSDAEELELLELLEAGAELLEPLEAGAELLELELDPPPQAARPNTMATAKRIAKNFFIFFLLIQFS